VRRLRQWIDEGARAAARRLVVSVERRIVKVITVSVWKPQNSEEDHDALLPFAAVDDSRFIALRGETADEAADNVIGAVLCTLGQLPHPPRGIRFEVKKGKPKR
jgi:hypothetical protein